MSDQEFVINKNERILVTGANGFIGVRVVESLLAYEFKNIRCFVRPSSNTGRLEQVLQAHPDAQTTVIRGNLLSPDDCLKATEKVKLVFHLAAGVEKSFAGCVLNSAVTTRNLLDAVVKQDGFRRFVNVSSIAVYSGLNKKRGDLIDEDSTVEAQSHLRFEGYTYGKIKQDEIVQEYQLKYNLPVTTVRPGVVYGPGKDNIFGRVGIDTFGIFMQLGGDNVFPITYVENCADAIVLAGLNRCGEGETFNIVDDNLPTCSQYLRMYKQKVRKFLSIVVPYPLFYFLSYIWEKYSQWSKGQLPPAFNRMRAAAHWKGHRYSNRKLKDLLDWKLKISTEKAIEIYFDYLKSRNL